MLTGRPVGDRRLLASGFGVDRPESVPPPKAFLFVTKKEPKKSHRFRGGGRTTRANALDSSRPPPLTGALSKEWIENQGHPPLIILLYKTNKSETMERRVASRLFLAYLFVLLLSEVFSKTLPLGLDFGSRVASVGGGL